MKTTKSIFVALFLLSSIISEAVDDLSYTQNFINKYKFIVLKESQRSKIPAAIIMSQAILESGWGRSSLAIKANNYFGIKCHNDWVGDTYSEYDDDFQNGELVASCFRKYESIEVSFSDYSKRITTKGWYKFLFDLPKNDYVKWAEGLKKAGYASRKDYARKLISIIEQYHLYQLDNELEVRTGRIASTAPLKKKQKIVPNYRKYKTKTYPGKHQSAPAHHSKWKRTVLMNTKRNAIRRIGRGVKDSPASPANMRMYYMKHRSVSSIRE